jgi:DNA-directed RNA polymerase subunit RPC12/RpoP
MDKREYEDEREYEPVRRPGPRRRKHGAIPCPKCGSRAVSNGPWPWYLGTVGLFFCQAMICDDCGHEFDAKKPQADLATRKLILALAINAVGLVGIIAVVVGLGFYIMWITKR